MLPDLNEGRPNPNPVIPDQEGKDPQIAKVMRELIDATQVMRDPDYGGIAWLTYESFDGIKTLAFSRNEFPEAGYQLPPHPNQIIYKEQALPVIPASLINITETEIKEGREYHGFTSDEILIHLDENAPRIFQLKTQAFGRYFKYTNERRNGRETVVEQSHLLPSIIEAVSGRKGIQKEFERYLGAPTPQTVWRNTFEPQGQPPTKK